ncbi:MAG TPA: hypothetical protein VNP98_02280 [Chthoniobacterales bacterium]|nr:hypothetical protein [Chthoniobacterales bacterium]
MNKKTLLFYACVALLGTSLLPVPKASAQSELSGAAVPIEMVAVVANGAEKRVNSFDGVMEPVGLPAGEQIALTL